MSVGARRTDRIRGAQPLPALTSSWNTSAILVTRKRCKDGPLIVKRQSPAILVWRSAHALVAVGFLASIGYVWWCAVSGRRGRLLRIAVGALSTEGILVVANHGDCPLGPWEIASVMPYPYSSSSFRPRQRDWQSPYSGPLPLRDWAF